MWADFYSVLEVVYITYNMGTWDLPDIYARALGSASYNTGKSALPDIYAQRPRARSTQERVRIYQAKHDCLCYN